MKVIIWRILIVFSLASFGILARKFNWIREEARSSFADAMLNLTLPPLIFVAMAAGIQWRQLSAGFFLPLFSLTLILVTLTATVFLRRLLMTPAQRAGTFSVLAMMPNTGFIGFPIIFSICGKEGLAYAVLYDLGVSIAFCTVAVIVLKGGRMRGFPWKDLFNPTLVAALAGLAVNKSGIVMPTLLMEPLRTMGNATVPLAMLLMGYMIGGLTLPRKAVNWELAMVSVIKLLLYPLAAFVLTLPFHLNAVARTVVILEAAMPSMASTAVLVEKYGGDGEFAATAILATTLLSMLSIPVISHFLIS